jgi:hypothetical protein
MGQISINFIPIILDYFPDVFTLFVKQTRYFSHLDYFECCQNICSYIKKASLCETSILIPLIVESLEKNAGDECVLSA